MSQISFFLKTSPAFRLDLTVWVIRRRAKNTVDLWDGHSYYRMLTLGDIPVKLAVSQNADGDSGLLVNLYSEINLSAEQQAEARGLISKMLGLSIDLAPFYVLATATPSISALVAQFYGVRPPRFPTVFETLVNAIACQQVSLDVGILILGRLATSFGMTFMDSRSEPHAFPRPDDLVDVPEAAFKELGLSYQKTRAIKGLALGIMNGDIDLAQLESANNEKAALNLRAIHGIGRWSAEYTLLRGLGRLDVFPGDDIGGQNNIQKLLRLDDRPDYGQLKILTSAWHPYAGFIYFHLLLDRLHAKGLT
ncbi:MAG: DNA-3-methyladenine glycosylase 2 family protein [Pseudomonadota bacterium]|nr:DNA-3-methyladenine glycosylase 2 family protein [Pseudomonadota bacterium]